MSFHAEPKAGIASTQVAGAEEVMAEFHPIRSWVVVDLWNTLVESRNYDPVMKLSAEYAPECRNSQRRIRDGLLFRKWENEAEAARCISATLGRNDAEILASRLREEVLLERRDLRPRLGAEMFIEFLRWEEVEIVLASNLWCFSWPAILEALPALNAISHRVFSFERGADKQADHFWTSVMQTVDPDSTTFVIGDSWDNDIIPGLRLGFHPIHLRSAVEAETEPLRDSRVLVCGNLHEARRLLEKHLRKRRPRSTAASDVTSAPAVERQPRPTSVAAMARSLPVAAGSQPARNLPTTIEFQTISYCNATCRICPWPEIKSQTRAERMSDPVWSRLREDLREIQPGRVIPYLNNEPLLDRDLCNRIAEVREDVPDAWIEISTNGVLLDLEKFQRLCRSGVNEIRVSIFGYDAVSNREIMGTDFERVLGNLERIRESPFRREVQVRIIQVASPLIPVEGLMKVRDAWRRDGWEVDTFGFLTRSGNVTQWSPVAERDPGLPLCGCELNRHRERMYVLVDGTVLFCCHDWRTATPMGNIRNERLSTIWTGPMYETVRAQIEGTEAASPDFICRHCKLARS